MTSDTECTKSTVESQHKQPQQSQSPHGHPPEPRAVRRAQSTEPGTDTDTCTGAARRRARAHNYPSSAAAAAAEGALGSYCLRRNARISISDGCCRQHAYAEWPLAPLRSSAAALDYITSRSTKRLTFGHRTSTGASRFYPCSTDIQLLRRVASQK